MGNLAKTQILLVGLDGTWRARLWNQYENHFAIAVAGTPESLAELEKPDAAVLYSSVDVAVIYMSTKPPLMEQRLSELRKELGLAFVAVSPMPISKSEASGMGLFSAVTLPEKSGEMQETDFYVRLTCQLRNARLSCGTKRQGFKGKWVAFPQPETPPAKAAAPVQAKSSPVSESESVTRPLPKPMDCVPRVIAVGASAGGTRAITDVMQALEEGLPPIVVVQHMPKGFTGMFAKSLDERCALTVVEGKDGMELKSGMIYIAPGDLQTTVSSTRDGLMINCRHGEKVSGHRPSVDVLFASVAQAVGSSALGIILTGMGSDGAQGLLQMRRVGAYTIGQDEATSAVYGMPRSAMEIGAVCQQLPLEEIPHAMAQCGRKKGKAAG